jgi:hypothetical protein
MADNVSVSAGEATYTAATDDCTTGHVPLVKLTYGANGDRTHVPADADGLLVNLGANNDVVVSNGGTFPVQSARVGAGAAAITSVNDTASSTTLKTGNADRLALIIYNASTAVLYVKYGDTATTSDYTYQLGAGESYREELYTGRVDGIWASDASGAAKVTELTAS